MEFITKDNYNLADFMPKMSRKPTSTLVPNEAISIADMLERTSRGQRINVNTRMRDENHPDNLYEESVVDKISETFDNAAPDKDFMSDVVDVLEFEQKNQIRKNKLNEKNKVKEEKRVSVKKEVEKPDPHTETPDEVKEPKE